MVFNPEATIKAKCMTVYITVKIDCTSVPNNVDTLCPYTKMVLIQISVWLHALVGLKIYNITRIY